MIKTALRDIENWLEDYFARCDYCGWYLHPQRHFRNVKDAKGLLKRPSSMTYCQTKRGYFICANCAANPNSDY